MYGASLLVRMRPAVFLAAKHGIAAIEFPVPQPAFDFVRRYGFIIDQPLKLCNVAGLFHVVHAAEQLVSVQLLDSQCIHAVVFQLIGCFRLFRFARCIIRFEIRANDKNDAAQDNLNCRSIFAQKQIMGQKYQWDSQTAVSFSGAPYHKQFDNGNCNIDAQCYFGRSACVRQVKMLAKGPQKG